MKQSKLWAVLCTGILLAGIVICLWAAQLPKGKTVELLQDGKVLYTFDLSGAEDQIIKIPYQGSSNTIQIQDGRICVQSAECPDQTCVRMGFLSDSGLPVVCLPNRLVIQFSDAELDGVVN